MISEQELNIFAEAIISSYKRTSILNEITTLIDYSGQSGNYFQIGERVLIPKRFFDLDNKHNNTIIAGQFCESIVLGEKNFLLKQFATFAKTEKKTIRLNKPSYEDIIQQIENNFEKPTDIFMPIDYFHQVFEWTKKGLVKYEEWQPHFSVGSIKIKIHWAKTKLIPFKDIIILDKTGIKIIQKRFNDIQLPPNYNDPKYSYKSNEPIRLDFAESNEPDNFDFYFRSLIAIDKPLKDSLFLIELP